MNHALAARASMGTSLGFHIIFAVLGVGLPVLLIGAEGIGLWRHDEVWLRLAHRWAKAFGILFAVGAVSGTVLSFELGLLWPAFMRLSGSIIGLPFSAEGVAFFLEAIFLGLYLYLYGWERLSPLAHWLCGLPIALSGAASALFVTTVNAWMNAPAGFRLSHGRVVAVDPWQAIMNPATPTQTIHMLVAAYAATGFGVAAVYAAGLLRGRDDVLHRRGLVAGMALGALCPPLLALTGDASARFVATDQPTKLAAMEALFRTTRGAPLAIGGLPDTQTGTLWGAIEIPRLLSVLVAFDPNARVRGLAAFPRQDWPLVVPVHLAFDVMAGMGCALLGLALWFWVALWRGQRVPTGRLLLVAAFAAGPLSFLTIEAGWLVTEFGRQPWVVYGVLRTADAVTPARGVTVFLVLFLAIYVGLALTTVRLLLLLAERDRQKERAQEQDTPARAALRGGSVGSA